MKISPGQIASLSIELFVCKPFSFVYVGKNTFPHLLTLLSRASYILSRFAKVARPHAAELSTTPASTWRYAEKPAEAEPSMKQCRHRCRHLSFCQAPTETSFPSSSQGLRKQSAINKLCWESSIYRFDFWIDCRRSFKLHVGNAGVRRLRFGQNQISERLH